jgi:hypothetical protein
MATATAPNDDGGGVVYGGGAYAPAPTSPTLAGTGIVKPVLYGSPSAPSKPCKKRCGGCGGGSGTTSPPSGGGTIGGGTSAPATSLASGAPLGASKLLASPAPEDDSAMNSKWLWLAVAAGVGYWVGKNSR